MIKIKSWITNLQRLLATGISDGDFVLIRLKVVGKNNSTDNIKEIDTSICPARFLHQNNDTVLWHIDDGYTGNLMITASDSNTSLGHMSCDVGDKNIIYIITGCQLLTDAANENNFNLINKNNESLVTASTYREAELLRRDLHKYGIKTKIKEGENI